MGIHDRINVSLPRIEEKIRQAEYSEENKTAILDYENYIFAEGIKPIRIFACISTLHRFALSATKNFKDMNRIDVQNIVANIEKSNISDSSKREYKVRLKKFFKWLQGEQHSASWVKTSMKNSSRKLPDTLFTEEEVGELIKATKNPRDRALISLLFDSGCRIGEIGDLRKKDIIFDEHGAVAIVNGKTGARRIRLMFSGSAIADWMEYHPKKEDANAYLFVNLEGHNKGKQIQYDSLDKILKNVAERAGLKKRVHLHLFRHSRATMYAEHLTESQMDECFGWVQGSRMSRTYVHLSGKQIDDAILSIYGKKKKEETLPILMNKKCPRCKKENGPTSSFCTQCGQPLDVRAMQDVEDSQRKLMQTIELLMKTEDFKALWDKVSL